MRQAEPVTGLARRDHGARRAAGALAVRPCGIHPEPQRHAERVRPRAGERPRCRRRRSSRRRRGRIGSARKTCASAFASASTASVSPPTAAASSSVRPSRCAETRCVRGDDAVASTWGERARTRRRAPTPTTSTMRASVPPGRKSARYASQVFARGGIYTEACPSPARSSRIFWCTRDVRSATQSSSPVQSIPTLLEDPSLCLRLHPSRCRQDRDPATGSCSSRPRLTDEANDELRCRCTPLLRRAATRRVRVPARRRDAGSYGHTTNAGTGSGYPDGAHGQTRCHSAFGSSPSRMRSTR